MLPSSYYISFLFRSFLFPMSTLRRGPLTFNSNFQTFENLKTLTFFPVFVLLRLRGRDENGKTPRGNAYRGRTDKR